MTVSRETSIAVFGDGLTAAMQFAELLAIARPDLDITLLEPMARRVAWLTEVVDTLSLSASVVRGRAEEPAIKQQLAGADVVIARAVAPLARLWVWSAPLLRQGGQ